MWGRDLAGMASIHMDVVVIGGGIVGTSIVHALARRGVRNVLLLEQRATAANTSQVPFGIVRTYHRSRVMVSLARRSVRLYEQFAEEIGGAAALIRTGMIVVVPEGEQEMLEANVGVARHLGSSVQFLPTSDDVRAIEPRINLDHVAAAAYEAEAGYGDPARTAAAFAIRARDLGVQVRQGIRILNIDTTGEGPNRRITGVLTDGGYVNTDCVIYAGGWGNTISEMVGVELPVHTYRYLGVVCRHPPSFGGPHPITLDLVNGAVDAAKRLRQHARRPARRGGARRPSHLVRTIRVSISRAHRNIKRFSAAAIPTLATATVRAAWAASHDVSPDWYPMVGPSDGVEGFYCAVGMGGYNFVLAPAIGEMVARLVTDEATDGTVRPKRSEDLDPKGHAYFFRPGRFANRPTGAAAPASMVVDERCPPSPHEPSPRANDARYGIRNLAILPCYRRVKDATNSTIRSLI